MRFAAPCVYIALLCALTGSAGATCATEPRSEAGVRLAEQRWVIALEQRDSAALDCILAPEFADTSWRGTLIARAEVMNALPHRPHSTLELTNLQPVLIGDVAVVRGINTQSASGKVLGSVRFVDVFVYRLGRWQAVSAQETPIQQH